MTACACPDTRGVYVNGVSNQSDPYLKDVMNALRRLYRTALLPNDNWLRSLPNGSSFVVILGDYDGNRDRLRAGRRDADRGWKLPLGLSPPPLVPSAFGFEHAVAAPTFTHDLLGWASKTSAEVELRNLRFKQVVPPWRERTPKLVWRGSAGPMNHDVGRDNLLRASRNSPELSLIHI